MNHHPNKGTFYQRLHFQIIVLILLAVLPILLLVIYSGIEGRQSAIIKTQEETKNFVKQIASDQEDLIDVTHQLFFALSHVSAVRQLDLQAVSQLFGVIRQKYGYFTLLGLVDAKGYIVGGSPIPGKPISVSDRDYYKECLRTRAFTVGVYQLGRVSGKANLAIAYPIESKKGNHRGMIVTGLDLSWLEKQFEKVPLVKGATLRVIDRNGTTLVRYPGEERLVGKTQPDSGLIKSILAHKEGRFVGPGFDGLRRHYAFTPLKRDRDIGFISLGIPESVIYAEPNRVLQRNLIWLAVVTVLAVVGSWFLGSFLVLKKIDRLTHTAKRVAGGDLTARNGLFGGDGEIDRLAQTFDDMTGKLQQRESERIRAQETLQGLMKESSRSNEDLKASNKELDDFAYIASHDLREPLRGIINYATFLTEDYASQLDEKGKSMLSTLIRLSQHQESLIQSLLEYSRVGRLELAYEEVDLNRIVEGVWESVQTSFGKKDMELIVPDPLPSVLCDRARINALFSNLVTNALKYNDKAKKVVEVGFRQESRSSEQVDSNPSANPPGTIPYLFYVRDNGIGIERKHLDRIFQIFKRLHSKEKYGGGTGIGLTIVRKIIDLHKGKIWAESVPNEGTTFYFTLQAKE
jgi:signal transduction histidine kinase